MEFDNFAQNFLKKQTITADILISEAEIELQKLEGKIKALEEDAFKFKQLIKNFTVKSKTQAAEYFDYNCEFSSLDNSSKNLINKIIALFEGSQEKEIPVRFIINNISIIENHQDGLRCIQWLINKMILSRNNKNYKIIKGSSWETKNDLMSIDDTVSSETGTKN
jgi:hypothetical protein